MNHQDLYQQLLDIIGKGDEEKAKQFVLDNIASFPEETQQKIVSELFFEALQDEVEKERALQEFKEKGVEAIKRLEKEKEELSE